MCVHRRIGKITATRVYVRACVRRQASQIVTDRRRRSRWWWRVDRCYKWDIHFAHEIPINLSFNTGARASTRPKNRNLWQQHAQHQRTHARSSNGRPESAGPAHNVRPCADTHSAHRTWVLYVVVTRRKPSRRPRRRRCFNSFHPL